MIYYLSTVARINKFSNMSLCDLFAIPLVNNIFRMSLYSSGSLRSMFELKKCRYAILSIMEIIDQGECS